MPNYKGHLAGGAIMFLLLAFLFKTASTSFVNLLEWLGCALLGALFPDIDTKSKGQQLFYRLFVLTLVLLFLNKRFLIASSLGIIGMLPLIGRHRGIFHSYFFVTFLSVALAGVICIYFPNSRTALLYDLFFFIAGIYSHLFLDFRFRKLKFFKRRWFN